MSSAGSVFGGSGSITRTLRRSATMTQWRIREPRCDRCAGARGRMTDQVGVVGAGAWGTTLAIKLAAAERPVTLWAHTAEAGEELATVRENRRYLPGIVFPPNLRVATDDAYLSEPHRALRAGGSVGARARQRSSACGPRSCRGASLLSVVKGIEQGTHLRMSEVIEEELPGRRVAALSGPNLAREIAAGLPAVERGGLAGRRAGGRVRRAAGQRPLPRLHQPRPGRRRAVRRPEERGRPGRGLRRRARLRRQRQGGDHHARPRRDDPPGGRRRRGADDLRRPGGGRRPDRDLHEPALAQPARGRADGLGHVVGRCRSAPERRGRGGRHRARRARSWRRRAGSRCRSPSRSMPSSTPAARRCRPWPS